MEYFKVLIKLIAERKPALLDNATQILVAPLFVFMELCEMLGFAT